MNPEILKFCIEKGLLLDKEAGEILSSLNQESARKVIEEISHYKEKIINRSFFSRNSQIFRNSANQEILEKLDIKFGVSIEIHREQKIIEKPVLGSRNNVKVLYTSNNQTKKIVVEDFVKYFRSRVSELKKVLQERPELENLVSINKISGQKQNFSLIGIVYSKRVTKNKNILLEMEDLTGRISVLVNQNKPDLYEKAKDLILDSVIGVKGSGSNEFFFANEIIYPESIVSEKTLLDRDESIAFTSDTHVGSKMFLEKNFLKFIKWLNGEMGDEKQKEEARKIKYLLITGDSIDGIGVYPGQEDLLNIKGVKEQYSKLAEFLSMIRKDVTIILCPGQHDAVRVAEPQPAVGKEHAAPLHEMENVVLVSNPALIEISNENRKGVKILMYHGASMNSFINEVDSLRTIKAHDTPSKVVKYLLKFRHLSPIHSAVTYIPNENSDDLVIKEVPDIIATGDLHKPDVDKYNNVLIVCSSCWQSITPFEEKVGNHPDPCKVPVLNLKTRQIKIMDFSGLEEEEKKCEEGAESISCKT